MGGAIRTWVITYDINKYAKAIDYLRLRAGIVWLAGGDGCRI